jgi:hypothetical protein
VPELVAANVVKEIIGMTIRPWIEDRAANSELDVDAGGLTFAWPSFQRT